ncbi:MAG TPA: lysophospholipid acyltransferase family protein [Candidatus Limnocylindrales bacterium]|nr:lysophospholipid acyltransferase family protein [Candidatus Limnocylindrales bacterium]
MTVPLRYWATRVVCWVMVRCYVRLRVVGRENIPRGPVVFCFGHPSWTDPIVLMASLPFRPRLFFFGPKEEHMAAGANNRLMAFTGVAVPYRPGKNDLLNTTRRVAAVFQGGGSLAVAAEGRIHAHEAEIHQLDEGVAYFALRAGRPIVPVAINGSTWLALGRRVRVNIGEPIVARGRPTREALATLTALAHASLVELSGGYPDPPRPGPIGRWLTELNNEWPGGERPV